MKKIVKYLKKYYIALLMVIIVLPFRLYHITYPILDSFNFRQTQTATFALNQYKYGLNLFRTELDILGIGKERYLTLEFPVYEVIVALLYKIFSVNEIWGRVISILAGFIGAWFLYRLVDLILNNKRIAMFSSFFFLFSPLNMFYHRAFMIDPTIIAFLIVGLYHTCRWILHAENKSFILALIFLSIGYIQKGLYGPFWIIPVIVLFFSKKKYTKKIFSFKFIMIILLPLFILFTWQGYENRLNISHGHNFFTTQSEGHIEWNFGFLSDRLSKDMWSFRLKQIVDGIFLKPGVIFVLIGLISMRKYDKSGFFYAWSIAQILYFLILFRIQSQNYYQLIMIPVASVFIATGLYFCVEYIHQFKLHISKNSRIYVNAGVAVFLSFFIYKSWMNIQPFYSIDWNWYSNLKKIGEVTPSNSVGLFVTPGYDWNSAYSYYSKKKMKTISIEDLTAKNVTRWKKEGYSFVVLYDYKSYDGYLSSKQVPYSINFITKNKLLTQTDAYKLYSL